MRHALVLILIGCSAPSSPLIAPMLSQQAASGETVVDVEITLAGCATSGVDLYRLAKEQGNTRTTAPLTATQYFDLVAAADTSYSAFDTEASAELGTWWSTMPSTSTNDGKTLTWLLLVEQLDACGC